MELESSGRHAERRDVHVLHLLAAGGEAGEPREPLFDAAGRELQRADVVAGGSYGTFLGATYAALFPEHVGRMVLDGAMDPTIALQQNDLRQVGGFQLAFDTDHR